MLSLRSLVEMGDDARFDWAVVESDWQEFSEAARLPEDLKFLAPLDQSPAVILGFNGTTAGTYHAEEVPSVVVK